MNDDIRETIGAKLKAYRLEREWTYRQLSLVTGVSIVGLWQIEHERVTPHELTVHRIIKRLPGLINERTN